ncbi:MAG: DUF2155 domain-containing protein [Pseudomonadota bacterium]
MIKWLLVFAGASIVVSGAIAQTIETLPLDDQTEAAPETDRAGRFQRAPFRTYLDDVGPSRPRPIQHGETFGQLGARVRELDKMTGAIETLDIPVGEESILGRLRIRIEACRTDDEQGLTGAIALMKIWDVRSDRQTPDFSGWMFAESPALSALDHPRYDVWVLNCITASGSASSGSE